MPFTVWESKGPNTIGDDDSRWSNLPHGFLLREGEDLVIRRLLAEELGRLLETINRATFLILFLPNVPEESNRSLWAVLRMRRCWVLLS